jgi:hypothetical protein
MTDQIQKDKIIENKGIRPDKNALKNPGDGVNKSNLLFLTNQSNDTKGSEEEPMRSLGDKISFIVLGKLML